MQEKSITNKPKKHSCVTNTKKILIISFTFYPYSTVSAYRMIRFAKYLPLYGIEPHIITARHDPITKYYPDTQYVQSLFKYKYESPLNPLIFRTRKSFIKRGLNYFFRILKDIFFSPDKHILWGLFVVPIALRTIKKQKVETVLVSGDPFSLFVTGYLLKSLSNIKLILDYRDLWLSNQMNRIQTFVRKKWNRYHQKMSLKRADLIITVNEEILEEIDTFKERFFNGNVSYDSIVIPNGFDPEYFNDQSEVMSNKDSFTFYYAGKIDINSLSYNPRILLLGFQLFKEKYPSDKIKLVICGHVSRETMKFITDEGLLSDIDLPGHLPYDKVLEKAKEADALIHFNYPLKFSRIIPFKIYEYLKIKKPIISINSTEGILADLLEETRSGFSCNNEKPEETAFLMELVYKTDLVQFRSGINDEMLTQFDVSLQTKILADKIKELTSKNSE